MFKLNLLLNFNSGIFPNAILKILGTVFVTYKIKRDILQIKKSYLIQIIEKKQQMKNIRVKKGKSTSTKIEKMSLILMGPKLCHENP